MKIEAGRDRREMGSVHSMPVLTWFTFAGGMAGVRNDPTTYFMRLMNADTVEGGTVLCVGTDGKVGTKLVETFRGVEFRALPVGFPVTFTNT
jgi:hypothetical protein